MRVHSAKNIVLGIAFATGCHATASAGPVVLPFTWDPAQAGLVGSALTADTIIREEFLRSVVQPDGSFVATRIMVITGFSLNGGSTFTPTGLGSTYGLYFDIVDTGVDHLPVSITFTSSDFILKADPGNQNGPASATPAGIGFANSGSTADDITLAIGSLVIAPPDLTAPSIQSFTPVGAGEGGFFVSPALDGSVFLGSINTTLGALVVTPPTPPDVTTIVTINGGGFGASQFIAAPEPASLALLGTALGGLVMMRRRKA